MKYSLDKLPDNILSQLDLQTVFFLSRLLIAAERLEIFRKFENKELSLPEAQDILGIHPRYLEIVLNTFTSIGLLHRNNGKYKLSELAQNHFIDNRSIFFTRQFSLENVEEYEKLTRLEDTLTTGKSFYELTGQKEQRYTDKMNADLERAYIFTHMLYHYHKNLAEVLAENLDLKNYRKLLDVGGGSGVMSMALVRHNPELTATIFDIDAVCRVADGIIKENNLSQQINTHVGDMHIGFLSGYDVIMFCDVGTVDADVMVHAYQALNKNGMIVLLDTFLSDDHLTPLPKLLYQLVNSTFNMDTIDDMYNRVKTAGFKNIKHRNIQNNTTLITATKT